jgi:hypothetical protein
MAADHDATFTRNAYNQKVSQMEITMGSITKHGFCKAVIKDLWNQFTVKGMLVGIATLLYCLGTVWYTGGWK